MIETVQQTEHGYIVNGNMHVPNDPSNSDCQAILEWIAEGNMPRPPQPTPSHFWNGEAWEIELEDAKRIKRAELAEARWQAEVSGVNGIRTDRESQSMITGAALKAMQDSEYTCKWKTEAGFVELNAVQILAIADAVRVHVQGCFDREAELLALVEAATTPEELESIRWEEEE